MNGLLELKGKVKSYYIVYIVNFLKATVVILF